eukprot:7591737-Karenia_brevis.AAC.1
MSRITQLVETQWENVIPDDWVRAQRRRKWRLAGHVARRDDHRWSTLVAQWTPEEGYRDQGHPRMRWADALDSFFRRKYGTSKGFWFCVAQDREKWRALENEFVASE